jgi:alginate O-acetyltransferase complex protein AlgI
MSLNTPLFLFIFLPAALLLHLVVGKRARNSVLILASLVFLVFCDPLFFPLLLAMVLINYLLGLSMTSSIITPKKPRGILVLILVINIGLLLAFKIVTAYYPQFSQLLLGSLPGFTLTPDRITLIGRYLLMPVGLSFFTFQVLSYQIDVYKGAIKAEKNLLYFGLHLLMFPRLVAGPIMHFGEIEPQLHERSINLTNLGNGARRFVRGLAKKTLIADQLIPLDQGIFSLTSALISTPVAWLSLLAFTLRIYFDFSGYTDMALGIGEMLGFRFAENFNYPYISRSLSEFWRRWHMTLSWFREYVFYPLERRRHGRAGLAQMGNILIVFTLTGLWHGVTLNFILWGLFQGIIISLETVGLAAFLKKQNAPFQHIYALGMIAISWLIFASPSPEFSFQYLRSLTGLQGTPQFLSFYSFPPIQLQTWIALAAGILLSFPLLPRMTDSINNRWPAQEKTILVIGDIILFGLLILSLLVIANSTFQAYIYGRF